MFAGSVATASLHLDDRKGDVEAAPGPPLFSPRRSSASSSAGSSSGGHHHRQHAGGDEGSCPRVSRFSPFVGTEYSSPQTDGRERRPDSAEYLTPFSAPGGCASVTTVIASPSSERPVVNSPLLGRISGSPPGRPPGDALGSNLELHIPTSDSSPCPLHRDGNARSRVESTPTAPRDDYEAKASSAASSSPPFGAAALLPEGSSSRALDSPEASADAASLVAMRSGTREGRQQSPQSSLSSSPSSTPCAPPPEESPAGGVVAAEKYAPAPQAPASSLQFSVMYTEEEHRVRLETHETEERRCLYQAHKAVLSVYRMWAAESDDADYGDGNSYRLLPVSSRWDDVVSTRLLEDRFYPNPASATNMSLAGSGAPPSSFPTATAVAANRVRSFLDSSFACARGWPSVGADREVGAAGGVLSHRSRTPRMTCGGTDDEARRRSPRHQLQRQASHTSSPSAFRMLEYSMQMPETASLLMCNSSEPPSLGHQARLFSPWRTAGSDQRDAAARSPRGQADMHVESCATRSECFGGCQRGPRVSRVPHRMSTSHAAVHLSSASSLSAASVSLWRQSLLESPSRTDTAAPLKDLPRDVALPAVHAAAAEAPSPLYRAGLSPSGPRGLSSHSAAQPGGRGATETTSSSVWNASANLVSTYAASRCMRPTANVYCAGNGAPGDAAFYTSNEAFRLRQAAALSGTSSRGLLRSPCDGIVTDRKTLRAAQHLEDRHQERLCSYVQYKRFFDAVYGEQSASPPFSRGPGTRTTTVGRTGPSARRSAEALPCLPFHLGGDRDASLSPRWARGRVAHRDPNRSSLRGTTAARRARTPLSQELTTASARLSDPVALRKSCAALSTASHDAALFAARLTRLSTLEKLCRAELQRRCMEDQSVLLHRFIVEGTAALQRGARAIAPFNQRRPCTAGGATEAYGMLSAWTFIPNEVDQM
ncbi:hypothetical protein LSCM4_00068 [Leishmania orientalis]|uniref:Uncharacterized protein n=1 Tax=Leishmania orientalis TaxID=2249476 RepID=A0A836GIT6_9TRYP|nr:hypothetical protein LSCM4_00068 [Leishmania orientalis]